MARGAASSGNCAIWPESLACSSISTMPAAQPCAAFELRSGGRGQLVTSKLGDLRQLRRLETQAVTSDSCELAGHPQPREAGGARCGS